MKKAMKTFLRFDRREKKKLREQETIDHMIGLCNENDLFVDVGASGGMFSNALYPYVQEVHCIEPIRRAAEALRNTGFQVYECVIDESEELQYFYVNNVFGWSGLYPQVYFKKRVRMQTTRLDSLFKHIDVLKVDVEGNEFRVLKSLGDIRPRVICIECRPERLGFDFEHFNRLLDEYRNHIGLNCNLIVWDDK